MSLEKFNGTWVQDTIEGDIEKWLVSEGVDGNMIMFAKMTEFGKGQNQLKHLVHEGTLYVEQPIMGINCHRKLKLGAGKLKSVIFDGGPLVPAKTVWLEAIEVGDGTLQNKVWHENMEKFVETQHSVSDDGNSYIVKSTIFLNGGDTVELTLTYKKNDDPPMTVDYIQSWCPFTVFPDASSPSAPDKKSVLTDSLEGLFSSSGALMDSLEDYWRHKEPSGNEKTISLEEISNNEFKLLITFDSDEQCSMTYKIDKEAGTAQMAFINTFGDLFNTNYYTILKDPLRLEVYQMFGDFRQAGTTMMEVEDQLWKAFQRSAK